MKIIDNIIKFYKSISKKFPVTTTFVIILALTMPLALSQFRLALIGKFVTYAIVALGLDLLWGYTGILSLGHGVYFSLGAYMMAMHLKTQTTDFQAQGLADFMTWSGLTKLPWFWEPFSNFAFTIIMVIVVPVLFSLVIGFPAFRSGIKGVYFTILTQALALSLSIFFIGQQPYTGGTNGITGFESIAGFSLYKGETKIALYIISVIILFLVYFLSKLLIQSKTGRILIAIREGENRLKFLGYDPVSYKVFIYALSAAIAGIAGALFVPQVGIINPSAMGILPSVEIAIWVAIGGRGTLKGAIIGAFVVNIVKTSLSETFPDAWWYVFGVIFILSVMFLPKGLGSLFEKIKTLVSPVSRKEAVDEK
ncbi:MAG: urea ABC transporter permease subunit UrtC [Spirochaetales bacterium]|nr:urea ABC transporter permease subunit UrtC [Spirochaetales bacterium]